MEIKKTGLYVSIVLYILIFFLKIIYGHSSIPIVTIITMLTFLILLISEAIPITLLCILTLGIMPVLKVTKDFNTALLGFSNQVVFFILASFGIAAAIMKVPTANRILKKLLLRYGKSSKSLVLVFMITCAFVSSVMSNVPSCTIFIVIVSEFLRVLPEKDRVRTGKSFMIGIPVASMIGGIMTPAGSSINILALSLLKQNTGRNISFVSWMMYGVPIALITLPIAWFIIVSIYPPAKIEEEKISQFIADLKIPERMLFEEKKVLAIFSAIFILWVASSWVHSINIMLVSILGCAFFCLPRVGVLSIEEFFQSVNWDAIFLVATVLSLSTALCEYGVSEKIVKFIPVVEQSNFCFCMEIAAITFLMLIIIPVAPSLITLFSPVVIYLAKSIDYSPATAILIFAMCAGNCYLFPIDTVCLISYSKGYYTMTEMAKSTVIIQLLFIIICSTVVFSLGTLV